MSGTTVLNNIKTLQTTVCSNLASDIQCHSSVLLFGAQWATTSNKPI